MSRRNIEACRESEGFNNSMYIRMGYTVMFNKKLVSECRLTKGYEFCAATSLHSFVAAKNRKVAVLFVVQNY